MNLSQVPPAFAARRLTKRFGRSTALREIDFELEALTRIPVRFVTPSGAPLDEELSRIAPRARFFRPLLYAVATSAPPPARLPMTDVRLLSPYGKGEWVSPYEAVQENYVITDNRRILRVHYVQPLRHVEGMLMAYLPTERIAFEADLFDTHEPPRAAQLLSMRTLATQVERMTLDVATLAPVHGKPVAMAEFMKSMGAAAKECPMPGGGGSVAWGPCKSQ